MGTEPDNTYIEALEAGIDEVQARIDDNSLFTHMGKRRARRVEILVRQAQRLRKLKPVTDWAYEQFDKHGIRRPESYTAEELKYLNPEVPPDFIDEHVRKRR